MAWYDSFSTMSETPSEREQDRPDPSQKVEATSDKSAPKEPLYSIEGLCITPMKRRPASGADKEDQAS
ncbi:hypothetical protein BH10PLA2_BH10PLA2_20540 [soil metagenome]